MIITTGIGITEHVWLPAITGRRTGGMDATDIGIVIMEAITADTMADITQESMLPERQNTEIIQDREITTVDAVPELPTDPEPVITEAEILL